MSQLYSFFAIYKDCKILPNRIFCVENIKDYLDSLESESRSDIQYIKYGLNIEVKINKDQLELEYIMANNFNYSAISHDESHYVYYFIIKKEWLSTSCIKLTLYMDTINTFIPNVDFYFSNKTKILREHKDRFHIDKIETEEFQVNITPFSQWIEVSDARIKNHRIFNAYASGSGGSSIQYEVDYENGKIRFQFPASTITYSAKGILTIRNDRIIDLYSEGLNPILFKRDVDFFNQENNLDWYLIYMNQNEPSEVDNNPVNCFIAPSNRISLTGLEDGKEILPTDLVDGKIYYMMGYPSIDYNGKVSYGSGSESVTINLAYLTWYWWQPNRYNKCFVKFKKSGNKIKLVKSTYASSPTKILGASLLTGGIEVESLRISNVYNIYEANSEVFSISLYDISLYDKSTITYSDTSTFINPLSTLDRTDAKLIKIIKLPYCPLKIENGKILSGGIVYDSSTGFIKLESLDTKFNYEFNSDINPFEVLNDVNLYGVTNFTLKNPYYESKLFHSDYYLPKFIYDSFSLGFKLETINIEEFDLIQTDKFNISYVVSSTINSRFMFIFSQYVCTYANEDYHNVLPISRNNEITLYNNQYINYLRTGFNYDVKNKNMQTAGRWVGIGLSIAGAITSFALSYVTGGLSAIAGIGLATSIPAQIIGAANSTAQAENNLAAKQEQLKNQATSVSGSDDVDLMSEYTGNRAKLSIYEISPKMKKALFDVFFYTGYVAEYLGIPNLNTRTWFNFLSCELVIEGNNANLSGDILEDLKTRYGVGVTFLHNHSDTWDFSQQYENWEISLNIQDS